jgi:hypothetical protein
MIEEAAEHKRHQQKEESYRANAEEDEEWARGQQVHCSPVRSVDTLGNPSARVKCRRNIAANVSDCARRHGGKDCNNCAIAQRRTRRLARIWRESIDSDDCRPLADDVHRERWS